jgi:hypothetical protein
MRIIIVFFIVATFNLQTFKESLREDLKAGRAQFEREHVVSKTTGTRWR